MEKAYQVSEALENKKTIVYDIRVNGIIKGIITLEDEIKQKGVKEVVIKW